VVRLLVVRAVRVVDDLVAAPREWTLRPDVLRPDVLRTVVRLVVDRAAVARRVVVPRATDVRLPEATRTPVVVR
jgi:hypothetical protein